MNNNEYICNFEIIKSKDDKDVLIINGKYIHSQYFPDKEAKDKIYFDKSLIVIYGLGLAYHINNLIKNNPHSIFIIYEPYQEIFKLSKKYINDELYLKFKKNICILNENNFETIFDFLNQFHPISEYKIVTYSNIGYKSLLPETEKDYFENVKNCFEIIIQNLLTESNFTPLWTKNFIYNISKFDRIPFLNQIHSDLKNNIAVICCAGPNLINDLIVIKKNRDKITIFAVDTAIKTLFSFDLIPDFIVSLDCQVFTIDDFISKLPDESSLILDLTGYTKITELSSNTFFSMNKSVYENTILDYFVNSQKIQLNNSLLNTGGTISDYCLSLAIQFGFKKIYMAGLDLAFPYMQTHCKGSPFFNNTLNYSDYFNTIESIFSKAISMRELKDEISKVIEKRITTDFVLMNYANYFSRYSEILGNIKIFNSKFYGLKIKNLIEINLSDLLNDSDSRRFYWYELIRTGTYQYISKNILTKFFNDLSFSVYDKAKGLKNNLEENNPSFSSKDINELKDLVDSIIIEFPFLRKFIIMTEMILKNKNINPSNELWYKNISHRLLQSMYFIIRILAKIKNIKQ